MSHGPESPLKDQVAIVTGGAGGIGFETSKALSENGAVVVISDLNADRGRRWPKSSKWDFIRPT